MLMRFISVFIAVLMRVGGREGRQGREGRGWGGEESLVLQYYPFKLR